MRVANQWSRPQKKMETSTGLAAGTFKLLMENEGRTVLANVINGSNSTINPPATRSRASTVTVSRPLPWLRVVIQ